MKKLHILPLAEKITADNLYSAPTERKLPSVKIPSAVYTVLAVISFIACYTDPVIGIIAFGILFIVAGIDGKTGKNKKGTTVEKMIWTRLPLLFMGIFFILTSIFILISEEPSRSANTDMTRAYFMLMLKLFLIAFAVLGISRLIMLVTVELALRSRREHCGTLVHIEPDIAAADCTVTASDTEYKCHVPVYKYYYEGKGYRFTDHSRDLYFFSPTDSSLVYVDPEKPDRYYSPNLFADNGENLIEFLQFLGYMFVFSIPLLVVLLLKW